MRLVRVIARKASPYLIRIAVQNRLRNFGRTAPARASAALGIGDSVIQDSLQLLHRNARLGPACRLGRQELSSSPALCER